METPTKYYVYRREGTVYRQRHLHLIERWNGAAWDETTGRLYLSEEEFIRMEPITETEALALKDAPYGTFQRVDGRWWVNDRDICAVE